MKLQQQKCRVETANKHCNNVDDSRITGKKQRTRGDCVEFLNEAYVYSNEYDK